ncbi:hypothetical protein ILUMI_14150, partial [Ignelater luminosus]
CVRKGIVLNLNQEHPLPLCSLKSNNTAVSSRSSNVSSSSTPAIELLLRRVERIISTQDQQNIMLDNILRNLEVNNRVLERPADFPNIPVSNKTEYRCVEEFLSKDENCTYMVSNVTQYLPTYYFYASMYCADDESTLC